MIELVVWATLTALTIPAMDLSKEIYSDKRTVIAVFDTVEVCQKHRAMGVGITIAVSHSADDTNTYLLDAKSACLPATP